MKTDKKLLTRATILAADDLGFRDIAVPKWGGSVRINTMTAARGAEYLAGSSDLPYDQRFARLVVFTATDENGEPLFTVEDIPALCEKSLEAVYMLAREAMRLNGMESNEKGIENL